MYGGYKFRVKYRWGDVLIINQTNDISKFVENDYKFNFGETN